MPKPLYAIVNTPPDENKPRVSWWLNQSREDFAKTRQAEQQRMRNSEHGKLTATVGWADDTR